ncbi:hypothetical protein SEPCBS119000_004742 [Sporothrix epigloea]|uniref:WD repeat protein n=1 Tax=Sporothrix epigloea TaxID=1892477 RepID=A0ABP0DVZ7_9PEZI
MASLGKGLKSFHSETLGIQLNGSSDGIDTSGSTRVTSKPTTVSRKSSTTDNRNGNTPLAGRANTNILARDTGTRRDPDRDAPMSLFAARPRNKNAGPVEPASASGQAKGDSSGAASRLVSSTSAPSAAPSTTSLTTPRLSSGRHLAGSNGFARAARNAPFDLRKAPTPPAKRQKTDRTAQMTGDQVRWGTNPEVVLPKRTPEAVSLSQTKSLPGHTEVIDGNRVVYVLDSDDESGSAPGSHSAKAASPPTAQAPATPPSKAARLPPLKRTRLPDAVKQKRWSMASEYAPSLLPPTPSRTTSDDSLSFESATNKPARLDAAPSDAQHPSPLETPLSSSSTFSESARKSLQDRRQRLPDVSQQLQAPVHHLRRGTQKIWTVRDSLRTNVDTAPTTVSQSVRHAEMKATTSEDRSFEALFGVAPSPGSSASQLSPRRAAASVPSVSFAPYSSPATPATSITHTPFSPPPLGSRTLAVGEKLETIATVDMTPRKRLKLDIDSAAGKSRYASEKPFVRYTSLSRRPYLCSVHRTFVAQNYGSLPSWLGLDRPKRQQVSQPSRPAKAAKMEAAARSAVVHVDFLPEEIQAVLEAVRFVRDSMLSAESSQKKPEKKYSTPERELKHLLRRRAPEFMQRVVDSVSYEKLPGRYESDLHAFLTDAGKGEINTSGTKRPPSTASTLSGPAALTLRRHDRSSYTARQQRAVQATKLNAYVMMREVSGQGAVPGRKRQLLQFTNAVRALREDSLRLRKEWTNLAGDVTTISWASEDAFICGTTTHMDDRNHQYNRQGNLALASVRKGTVQAYPNHRIARSQVVPHGRTETYDDPWLYTSVVSSDYDATHDLAFTSSFDNTVQMWRVAKDGGTMSHQGTWKHEGKVNFVVVSSCPVCLVATAADVSIKAVRIYRLPTLQERLRGQRISYKTLSCERLVDFEGKPILPDKWSYLPATMRWGISEATRHLLLVGYSPRGLGTTAEDDDIPEDRRNSGELCLWNGLTGEKWRLVGGTSQNVFEVAWHPTQSCFIAATAPTLSSAVINEQVRTQIRIFRQSTNAMEYGEHVYSEVQTLDCYADDINELALRPNSLMSMYVAAGCTNGTTYVWDSSQGDDPIHALAHGDCLEELAGEVISVEDTGVKFVAWGATSDRLYTGSSDGLVKAWNVRTHSASDLSPFVRNVLRCPAPVSFGAFSPSKAQLAVGDASGRVFWLSVEDGSEGDDEGEAFLSEDEAGSGDDDDSAEDDEGMVLAQAGLLRRNALAFQHHMPEVIRHPTPPRPTQGAAPRAKNMVQDNATRERGSDDEDSGLVRSRAFLSSGQIVVHRNRTIGAVKGPHYAESNLFCRDFHQDGLPGRPLLAQYDRQQQENRPRASSLPSRQRALRSVLPDVGPSLSFSTSTRPLNAAVLGTPDPQQSLRRQSAVRRVQALHRENLARDFDVDSLTPETRLALELADRAALLHLDDQDDYGFVYEELPE